VVAGRIAKTIRAETFKAKISFLRRKISDANDKK